MSCSIRADALRRALGLPWLRRVANRALSTLYPGTPGRFPSSLGRCCRAMSVPCAAEIGGHPAQSHTDGESRIHLGALGSKYECEYVCKPAARWSRIRGSTTADDPGHSRLRLRPRLWGHWSGAVVQRRRQQALSGRKEAIPARRRPMRRGAIRTLPAWACWSSAFAVARSRHMLRCGRALELAGNERGAQSLPLPTAWPSGLPR